MNELTLLAIRTAKNHKRLYDYSSVFFMILTLGSLFMADTRYSIILLLLTMLALLSSNATQSRIELMEADLADDNISKYVYE